MLELSSKTNLLEENDYKYSLQDVPEPILYRDVYSYDEVPKVAFNHRRVPMNMPEDIWITDTTFRDGQQSVNPYTPDQIVDLYKLMARLGGPYGIIRQTEFFIYSQKDRAPLPGDHHLDPGQQGGFPAGAGSGHPGDGDSGLLQRLPHFQKAENDPQAGHGALPGYGEGRL